MKIAQLRGQPFLTLSSCKGFFGNPHNSNHTNSKPKQQNTSTTRMLLTSMELVGGSSLSRKKSHLHMEISPTHGPNWEVKVFLLQVTYAIIFHETPASLICSALWPPRGKDWFASPKWIMVQWLEPRDRLDSDQTTATPCSTLEVVKFVILQDISPYLYMANWSYISLTTLVNGWMVKCIYWWGQYPYGRNFDYPIELTGTHQNRHEKGNTKTICHVTCKLLALAWVE